MLCGHLRRARVGRNPSSRRRTRRSLRRNVTPAASFPSRSAQSPRSSPPRCSRSGRRRSSQRSSSQRRWHRGSTRESALPSRSAPRCSRSGTWRRAPRSSTACSRSGWLLLNWRDGRHGFLFVAGPILAAGGLLPLVPLVVQRAGGTARRAAHGALAVLAAALLAAVGGTTIPIADESSGSLGIGPLTPVPDASIGVWEWLIGHPATAAAAVLVAAAAALLPWARRASRYGVAATGFVLVAASVLAGAGIASTLVCLAAWAIAGLSAGAFRRVRSGQTGTTSTLVAEVPLPMAVLRTIESKIEGLFEGVSDAPSGPTSSPSSWRASS